MSEIDPAVIGVMGLLIVGVVLLWMRAADTRRREQWRALLVRASRAGLLRSVAVAGDGLRPIVIGVRLPTDAAWLLSDQGHHAIRAVIGDVPLTNRSDSKVQVG